MSTRLVGLTLQLATGHPHWKPYPRWLIPIAIWGSLLASISAGCDDAYVEGASGVVRALRGHPAIRMVSEEVHITLPAGKVEAKFVFKNEGPATEVVIGFPEEGKDGTGETHMKGFRSAVDGQAVNVAKWIQYKPTDDTD